MNNKRVMYKSKLQQLSQQRGWEIPKYEVTKEGQEHSPHFYATVTVDATLFSTPFPSSSTKKAQNDAAKLAYKYFSDHPRPSSSSPLNDCSGGSAGENTRPSPEGKLDAKPTPLSNEAGAVAKTDESFGVSAAFSGGSAWENTRLSQENPTPLSNTNPTPLSNEAGAVAKTDESFGGCSSGSAGGNARLSPRGKLQLNLQAANPIPLSNEAVAVGKNDESFEGCSSGSAGGNARLSPRGKLQLNLQAANPTPLSNEAVAVGKNDESFEGCSSGSAGGDSCLFPGGKLQLNLQDANPTPLSNEAVAVGKNDESFGGFSSGNAGGNTRLSPRGKLQLNLQVANPTPLSNEAMAVGKNDESFGGCSSGSAGENTRLSPGGKLQLNLQDANPTPLSNEAVANAKNDEIFGGMQHLFKNQLQTYAQKRNFTLPVYSCERVGPPHASRFKCKVTVNGQTYESEEYFPTLIKAELAAAKAALMSLLSNGVEEDESGYKNLLQDMARREGCGLPTYLTDKSGEAHAPTFISKVEIDGVSFTGKEARNKKQAEMSAAKIAYTALQQRYSSQEVPRSSPLSPARQSQEALQSETPQLSVSNLRAGLTAYLQQNIQPKLPVSNEQAEEYRDSPTNLATSSSIEFMVRGIRVLMHPSGTKMTYPAGSTVLPISDDKWAAVELPPQRSR
ncbi:hypothetical protein BDE02_19G039400 [Populus trichocarpa]|nr:hypothetical protein BDE02_19G039400 [Populus trichocarpa]